MSEESELLKEIRDLLLLIAEPAIARRDESRRNALREIVGRSKVNAKAVLMMDGTQNGAAISKESGIDKGQLSRLVKALRERNLIQSGDLLKLAIAVPAGFFEASGG